MIDSKDTFKASFARMVENPPDRRIGGGYSNIFVSVDKTEVVMIAHIVKTKG